ncbi:MAG TPA: TfoX/Sxy family protein [Myxococcaceae bacterium]|nr:TfoX/Sxy family protein [Myxococcaceae bacterium]
MSPLSSFAQHSVDLLSSVGPVKDRAMFGGYGLSLDGVSIGLIADDRLYLRVDDTSRPEFEKAGSAPFIYPSKNGPMMMKNYWAIPEDAVDDSERAAKWGQLAVEASRRAEAAKGTKGAKKKPAPNATKAPKPKALTTKVKASAASRKKPARARAR